MEHHVGIDVSLVLSSLCVLDPARSGKFSTLKRWAIDAAKRRGMRRAKLALARKLATVLHRI